MKKLVTALALMVVYSPLLAGVFLVTVPIYLGLMRFSSQRLRPIFDDLEEGFGRYSSHQIDAIKGIETVKAMGAEVAFRELMLTQFHRIARRQFRGIARVAGLLPPSLPGRAPRSLRQLQASSGRLSDVLSQHDPDHVLLPLARREALEEDLQVDGMESLLVQLADHEITLEQPESLTPLAFPLWADGVRAQLSTEEWQTRVKRAAEQLERRHGRR